MKQERGTIYALKVLLFGLLPLVAVGLFIFYSYARSREISLIERNYRVLETAKRQLQGRFEGRTMAYERFISKKDKGTQAKCLPKDANSPWALQKREGTLWLQPADRIGDTVCAMPIPKLATPLQQLNFFDHVILAEKKEDKYRIYYQEAYTPTGPIVDFRSLLEQAQQTTQPKPSDAAETKRKENGATPSNSTHSAIAEFREIFHEPRHAHHLGTEYRLFVIPVLLQQNSAPDKPLELLLAGLVSQQRFTQETHQLSPTLLTLLGFLFIMVVLGWPLVTLWYIGPSERLSGLHVRILVILSMFAVGLLTFVMLYSFSSLTLQEFFDTEIKEIGEKIQARFIKELEGMFGPLEKFKESIEAVCETRNYKTCTTNKQQDAQETGKPGKKLQEKQGAQETKELSEKVEKELEKNLREFDLLNLMSFVWLNPEGEWVHRWRPKAEETSTRWGLKYTESLQGQRGRHRNSRDRPFFIDAQAKRFWEVPRQTDSEGSNATPMEFTLEVVQSRINGEITVGMAVPLQLGKDGTTENPHVAAVSSRFRPLMQAILPLGVGFAVIDDTGDVLLHSDVRKNLSENILQECDNPTPIRSAMFAHRAQYIDSGYYGQGYRFYIQPLKDTPWFLMVFHEKDFLRRANVTLTVSFLVLFGFYMGSWGMVCVLLHLFGYRWEWLWPDPGHKQDYWAAAGMVFGTALACFAMVWTAHALSTVVMFWVVPPLLLALLYLKLGDGQHAQCAQWCVIGTSLVVVLLVIDARAWGGLGVLVVLSVIVTWVLYKHHQDQNSDYTDRAFQRAYVAMLFSLLVAVVIVPAMLVFLDVHQQTLEALVKHNQFHEQRALQKRAYNIRQERVDDDEPLWTACCQLIQHNDVYRFAFMSAYDLRQERIDGDDPSWRACCQSIQHNDVYHSAFMNRVNKGDPSASAGTEKDVRGCRPDAESPQAVIEAKYTSSLWTPLLCTLCTWSSNPTCAEDLSAVSRHASALILQRLSVYSWPGERFGVMAYNEASDLTRRSELRDKDRSFIWNLFGFPHSLFRLPHILVWALVGLLAGGLIYKGLLWVASRIFLMNYGENDLPRVAPQGHIALWLFVKPARQNFQKRLHMPNAEVVIDLLQTATLSELQTVPYGTRQLTATLIIVDHLEDRLHERGWSAAVLSLLEALAFRYDGPVVVLSAIDPLYSLSKRLSGAELHNGPTTRAADRDTQPQGTDWAEQISAAEELERWARVLAQFSQKQLALPVMPEDLETILAAESRNGPAHDLSDRSILQARIDKKAQQQGGSAKAQFLTIWLQCTRAEKLVLRQLAEEGFINPNNEEVIRNLGRRELIYRAPALQLMSMDFKQFVLRAESPQTIARWEGETEASWWSGLQTPLSVGLIIVAAFFFITQQELFTTMVALLGTFGAILPRILQPFGMLRGQPGESQSGENTDS